MTGVVSKQVRNVFLCLLLLARCAPPELIASLAENRRLWKGGVGTGLVAELWSPSHSYLRSTSHLHVL